MFGERGFELGYQKKKKKRTKGQKQKLIPGVERGKVSLVRDLFI